MKAWGGGQEVRKGQPEEKAKKNRVGGGGGGGGVIKSKLVSLLTQGLWWWWWWSGGRRSTASSFALGAGALARRFLLLVLTHGVGVAHDDFVHPGERLREEHRPLEEAQVAAVQRQRKDGVGLFR